MQYFTIANFILIVFGFYILFMAIIKLNKRIDNYEKDGR